MGLSAQVAVAEAPPAQAALSVTTGAPLSEAAGEPLGLLGKATVSVFLAASPAAGVCVEVGELSAISAGARAASVRKGQA